MIQQVNLYPLDEAANQHWLANPYGLAILATLAGLLASTGFNLYWLNQQQHQRQQLQLQIQTTATEITALQTKLPTPQTNNALDRQLQQTQIVYQSLSKIIEMLTDDQSDKAQGFSRYLSALADQADNKVWLSKIAIDSASNQLLLEGSSYQAELIPALLQRLQHTEAFQGRHFSKLQIQQNKDHPEQVDFSIGSGQVVQDEHEAKP